MSSESAASNWLRTNKPNLTPVPQSSPSSNPDWFGTFPLFKWANDAGGAAYNLGAKGLGDLTHFAEQDVIKPFETFGSDVYNAGDFVVDSGRALFGLGKTLNDAAKNGDAATKSIKDLIDSMNQTVKNLNTGQGINVNLGGFGSGSPVDLSGVQSLLSSLMGNTNATTSPSGGTDYTSLLLIGGLIVGAGLVVYAVAKRRKK